MWPGTDPSSLGTALESHIDELESERPDPFDDTVQGRLVRNVCTQDGEPVLRRKVKVVEGRPQGLARFAPNGDCIPGEFHRPS